MFKDLWFSIPLVFLLVFGVIVLRSLSPLVFPAYFLYIAVSIGAFILFSRAGFDVIFLFSKHLYILSIILLLLTFVIGSVTRGTIRWIPIGVLSFQPAEIIRPFLLVFFSGFLAGEKISINKFAKAILLLALPVVLILVQPSLGVSIMTICGFIGIVLASNFNKKHLIFGALILIVLLPMFWGILKPYQKERVLTFLEPTRDPLGAGYNSIQSTIAVGAGKLTGRGLGKGVQTQLSFLPEKQTDFVFAAISEELGFVGSGLVLLATLIILFRLTYYMEHTYSPISRAFLSGFTLTYLLQVFVHVGMNVGMLPVTGLPYPLISSGGSSLLGTMIGLGISLGSYKKTQNRIE